MDRARLMKRWCSCARVRFEGRLFLRAASAIGALAATAGAASAQDFQLRYVGNMNPEPTSMLGVDLNGDSRPDIIAPIQSTGVIGWFQQQAPSPDGDPTFAAFTNLVTDATDVTSLLASDIDADGDMDLLYASPSLGRAVWLEHQGGAAPTFIEHVLVDGLAGLRGVSVDDADGDGDLDVFVAAPIAQSIQWLENDGNVNPTFSPHVIDAIAPGATHLDPVDFDGDGDMDVVAALGAIDTIALYTNDGAPAPTFTRSTLVEHATLVREVMVVDYELDGDPDIIAHTSIVPNAPLLTLVLFLENREGVFTKPLAAPTGPYGEVFAYLGGSYNSFELRAFIGDLDMDGLVDVAADALLTLRRSSFAAPITFGYFQPGADARFASADVDQDGDVDLIWGETSSNPFARGQVYWAESRIAEHRPSGAAFANVPQAIADAAPGETIVSSYTSTNDITGPIMIPEDVVLQTAGSVRLASDVDLMMANGASIRAQPESSLRPSGNGDDIAMHCALTAPSGATASIGGGDIRLDGALTLESGSVLTLEEAAALQTGSPFKLNRIDTGALTGLPGIAADFDADGDIDIAFPETGVLLANRRIESGAFSFEPIDAMELTSALRDRYIEADINGDGLPDLLGIRHGAPGAGDLIVYRNLGGLAFELTEFEIDLGDEPTLYAADLNGDGADDALLNSTQDDIVSLFTFSVDDEVTLHPLGVFNDTNLYERGIADIDGDGDTDLITVAGDDLVSLLRNSGGMMPTFSEEALLGEDELFCSAADVNDDGLLDLLVLLIGPDMVRPLYWRANDPVGPAFVETIPVAEPIWTRLNARAVDVDADGDLDVVFARTDVDSHNRIVAVAEHTSAPNRPYTGVFTDVLYDADFVDVNDVNGDGYPDLIAEGYKGFEWHENLPQDGPAFRSRFIPAVLLATRWDPDCPTGCGLEPHGSALADFDLDGQLDVLLLRGATRPPLEFYLGGHQQQAVVEDGAVLMAHSHLNLEYARQDQVNLSAGEIRMEASDPGARGAQEEPLELEAMSSDLGPTEAGFDRALLGSYPIGTLRIGPAPTVVRLIDRHDNDGRSAKTTEAVYVDKLVIHAGSTLQTNGISVYYRELTLLGNVDHPLLLRPVRSGCPWDLTGDGFVDAPDLAELVSWWGSSATPLDFSGDGEVNAIDLAELISHWGACE